MNKLTNEDIILFKDKLLNEYSESQLDTLARISVEDIRVRLTANGDYNVVYMDTFPILDEINNKLENKEIVDICISCEIKALLKYLFKEIKKGKDELREKNKA